MLTHSLEYHVPSKVIGSNMFQPTLDHKISKAGLVRTASSHGGGTVSLSLFSTSQSRLAWPFRNISAGVEKQMTGDARDLLMVDKVSRAIAPGNNFQQKLRPASRKRKSRYVLERDIQQNFVRSGSYSNIPGWQPRAANDNVVVDLRAPA